MNPARESSVAVRILLILCVLTTAACIPERTKTIDPECGDFMTLSPDGHYLMSRTLMTAENSDRINMCLHAIGIENVEILKNLSQARGNQT